MHSSFAPALPSELTQRCDVRDGTQGVVAAPIAAGLQEPAAKMLKH